MDTPVIVFPKLHFCSLVHVYNIAEMFTDCKCFRGDATCSAIDASLQRVKVRVKAEHILQTDHLAAFQVSTAQSLNNIHSVNYTWLGTWTVRLYGGVGTHVCVYPTSFCNTDSVVLFF